jgi:hypothetical protein
MFVVEELSALDAAWPKATEPLGNPVGSQVV